MKATLFLCMNQTKEANFKTGIIEIFKPFQDGKKWIAVVKCIIKGRIATLTRPINRLSYRDYPYLMNQNVWPKLKFINEKNIKFLKKNWYIDFTFLGEDVVVHINIMLLSLFFPLPISFPVLLCYSLVDMRVNLGPIFVLILIYLVSDRRELSLSKHKLENLFFFTCLI